MPLVGNTHYITVGADLYVDNNSENHKYMYSQAYTKTLHGFPFEALIPNVNDFWGPKVLNLLVVTQYYEWNEIYASVRLEQFKQMFANWELYEAKVWLDRTIADEIDAINGNDAYNDLMTTLATHIENTCISMADFGWQYMGEIRSQPKEYFQPYIDEFYSRS